MEWIGEGYESVMTYDRVENAKYLPSETVERLDAKMRRRVGPKWNAILSAVARKAEGARAR